MTIDTTLPTKVKFLGRQKNDFFSVLKERIEKHFEARGISRFADLRMVLKTLFWLAAFFFLYLAIITEAFNKPVALFLAMLLGITQGYIGVNISHDALHGSYSSSPRLNRWLGFTFDLCGLSSYIWKITHNTQHHIYTNIHGHDYDIDKPPFLRLTPKEKWRPFHRFQHWYILPLYGLVGINWIFYSDYNFFFQEWKKGNLPKEEIVPFFFFKALNFTLMFIIPFAVMSYAWWEILLGYLALQMVGGFAVSIVFQLAHVVEEVQFPNPNAQGIIEKSWAVHEVETSANFGTSKPFVNWVTGGLNFQIEHHLFPYICHVHYKEISPIVKATAKEFQIPYVENDSVWKAVTSHLRHLKKMGKKEVCEECSERIRTSTAYK